MCNTFCVFFEALSSSCVWGNLGYVTEYFSDPSIEIQGSVPSRRPFIDCANAVSEPDSETKKVKVMHVLS